MTIQGRGVVAVLVAGLLVGLGACSSSGTEPRALPSPRTTASASQSPTVEAQVEAAVRRYFDAANRALATGDTRELESLSLPGCGCRQLVDAIHAAFAKGKSVGAHFTVTSIEVHDIQPAAAAALVRIHADGYQDVDHQGRVIASYPAGNGTDDMSLVRRQSTWMLTNDVRLEGGPR